MAAEWHPILAAMERQPGTWEMIDPDGRVYGRIQIRRVADGIRYRTEHQGELLGWATSLRVACEKVHGTYIRAHGPGFRTATPDLD